MTNLTISNQISKSERLAIATQALMRATSRRMPIELEDDGIDEGDKNYTVSYWDHLGNPESKIIPKKLLIAHVENNYRAAFDSEVEGVHVQWEDTLTAAQYLEENTKEVITDYLNHLK